jgi:Flp pilus assembly pilin Flp
MDTRRRKPRKKRTAEHMEARIDKQTTDWLHCHRLCGEGGAASIEYAILGSLIAAVIVLVVLNLGNQVRGLFEIVSAGW